MKMSDTTLITFRAITTFTNELESLFGSNQRSLKLYCRLINKTTLAHDKPIQKHIEAFREFCVGNREAITTKNVNKLLNDKVEYSQRVFIHFPSIFAKADKETTAVIWKHLLLISALIDPAGKAKEILKEHSDGQEATFLTDIINKVEKHVDPGANPMEAVSSIMQSGVFTDLIGGMNNGLQDGSLDLGKLMGAVQGMVTTLGSQSGDDKSSDDAMNMINTMIGSISAGAEKKDSEDGMPDIMSMMGPLLSSLGGGGAGGENSGMPDIMSMMSALGSASSDNSSIEEKIEAQVSAHQSSLSKIEEIE